eukprot:6202858-Pleurochrysis_carterae.AAC.3
MLSRSAALPTTSCTTQPLSGMSLSLCCTAHAWPRAMLAKKPAARRLREQKYHIVALASA